MASDEYFIKLGKSIAGPAKRERIEALWKAGKLAETAEVSPDKIHWETVKEFLEGKLADSVDLQQEDEEPEESEEEVVKPKRSKIKVESGSGVTSDINYINKLLNNGEIIKGFMGNFIITASLIFGVLVLIGIVGGLFRFMFNIGESPLLVLMRIVGIFQLIFMIYPVYIITGIGYSGGLSIKNMKNKRFVVAHAFGILMDVIANVTFVLFVSASVPIFLDYASLGLLTDKISGALIGFLFGILYSAASILLAFICLISIKYSKELMMVLFSSGENVEWIKQDRIQK